MTQICADCKWMQRDNQMRSRCYSPQLTKMRTAGIIVNFKRDATPEPDRSHELGTGKCGPNALNFIRREGL